MVPNQSKLAFSLQKIKDLGYRLTPQRIEILETIIESDNALTVQEIHAAIKIKHPHVSLDTIYRNLSTLTEAGLVGQINLQSRESAKFEFQGKHHHHHAVCLSCKKSFCLDDCSVSEAFEKQMKEANFRPVTHIFEVYGYCSECQESDEIPIQAGL
ncbi:MAG: transcriptional repressor [Leptospiraceae bacterium]|nr:transcriptional repressor [Leptospiraceae bacterium]MCB1303503.1 transcriptional repressor [Leptospiraceae bacterium]